MTLYFENEYAGDLHFQFDPEATAKKVIAEVMEEAGCPYGYSASMLLTDDEGIRAMNGQFRGIDSATDVLSFPMVQYGTPAAFSELCDSPAADAFDPESGELQLGDIVINVPRVFAQAEEYGHSVLREFAFLTAHSALHLIGYDHMEPEEAALMEAKQEAALARLAISREM